MRRLLIAVVVLVGSIAAAGFGYREYRSRQLPELAHEVAKNAALRLNDSWSYEIDANNITYGEMLQKLEKNVSEIDSKIIDLQAIQNAKNTARVQPVLDYLRKALQTLRAHSMATRKEMETKSAFERAQRAYEELQSSSGYSRDYAIRSADTARQEALKVSAEYRDALQGVKRAVDALTKTRAAVSTVLPGSILHDAQLAGKVQLAADAKLRQLDEYQ